ncbi:alcohol acetyltransferase [Sporodiniella umbellata]|nr:alcohol acetyltransferase [Sporodiniella umbellata]
MENIKEGRRIGVLEKYQSTKQLVRSYGNVCFTAELRHPECVIDAAQFYQERLRTPLRKMIERHSSLSWVLREIDTPNVCFKRLKTVDLTQVVEVAPIQNTSVNSLTQEQCTIEFDFDSELPLWRLKIVPVSPTTCLAAFSLNHVIGDGSTLKIFWTELLHELQTEHKVNEESFIVQTPENLKPDLTYEDSGCPKISFLSDVLPKIIKSSVPKFLTNAHHGWAGDFPAVEGEPHSTEVLSNKIDSLTWGRIMKESKNRQISGHAVVYALFVLAWATLYNNHSVSVGTPINCRPLCNPPLSANQMGNYVGQYDCYWKKGYIQKILKNKSLWDFAKKYNDNLQKGGKLKGAKAALILKFLKYPEQYLEFFKDKRKYPMKRGGGLELSDIGKVSISGDSWEIESLYFCQSAHTYGTAFGMNSTCLNGILFYTLCWQKGSLDQEKIDLFNKIFNDLLNIL